MHYCTLILIQSLRFFTKNYLHHGRKTQQCIMAVIYCPVTSSASGIMKSCHCDAANSAGQKQEVKGHEGLGPLVLSVMYTGPWVATGEQVLQWWAVPPGAQPKGTFSTPTRTQRSSVCFSPKFYLPQWALTAVSLSTALQTHPHSTVTLFLQIKHFWAWSFYLPYHLGNAFG